MYKATPITYRAKSSPLPANEALIDGAATLGESKAFKNYGDGMEEKFSSSGTVSDPVDHGASQKKENEEKKKKSQSSDAVGTDSTKTPKV
jgi:hypothetical protein